MDEFDFNLGFDPSFFDFNIPDFDFPDFSGFDFNFDFGDIPTFDPGQFDLGFNPSFDLGQYAPALNDPFALPTGDLNLPNFDVSSFLATEPTFGLGDFNPSINALGSFDFVPTSFGPVPELSPETTRLEGLGPSLGAFNPYADMEGNTPFQAVSPPQFGQANLGTAPKSPTSNPLQDAQASYYKWAPLLGLGQLALGLGGGLAGALSGPPERKISQFEKDQAAAEIQLKREQMALQKEIAQMQMEAAMAGSEVAERHPLFESDPRFSTLYNQVTADQSGLSPDNPEIQAMTQQIYSVRRDAAMQEYRRQKDAAIERANRLGTNPAAELAQINEAEQKAMQALLVEAQQAALAFAQSRLDPANQLLQSILRTVV